MQLTKVTKTDVNLSVETEVLNYTYTATSPLEVMARVNLGDSAKPLSGAGGFYVLNFYINSVLITPSSQVQVAAGLTKAILISRPIPIEQGDVLSVKVLGLAGDLAVNTVATLRNVTQVQATEVSGSGTVTVDHNYGGPDNLSYQTSGGVGIEGATIRAYLAAGYAAGNTGNSYILAWTTTDVYGRWVRPMVLDPGDYTLVYFKPGVYVPTLKDITVT